MVDVSIPLQCACGRGGRDDVALRSRD
ncbi:hypothetical protein PPL_01887 [Heterostelium album PN500]|uniref:Uncharacterized protein n=1 Tax=Heterostelium pallidum (strain ATCC 26659 / Pp 5 / PN500) TaxID=670386 RepID=D3B0S0_HETP5|nr:hypothetical protein PPL_01887 [Heterostelium album PN500]